MRNKLEVVVSVDMTVAALTDVETIRKSERSMRLQLLTAGDRVGGAGSRERKGNLALEEGEARLQVLPAEREDDVQV